MTNAFKSPRGCPHRTLVLLYPGIPQTRTNVRVTGLSVGVCWCHRGYLTGNLPAHMFVELGSQFSWVVGPPVFPTCGFLQQRRLTRKHTVHQTICTSSCFLHLRLVFWIAIKQQCLFIWATLTKK